ncbi:FAD binding domain-containing protein [Colletotrichum scovillei]|uniref:FAD binding domain-containing protein n=1 Tax=Colletotrichum scovillei TaxID=1209932 RepID=A0A9P7U8B7_9PEZI|nr:FAD binding domain-containing protein [Colletotrichum scovillei]KAF4781198.1 FAD binding domain-containing protein [Colletotrichum scovillei]KAG7039138.1 FAD binding domain-containing protein [Colletotrichum scovillei]KAG7041319.1 FAD binding domain-containing protein [Colletotrichum scovillei]KAG7061348.1 FAD binding domain-containing protein [Colletotrichum scovillei]
MKSFVLRAALAGAALAAPNHRIGTAFTERAAGDCKCFPGDACWPATAQWDALNTTVGGNLIATVPLGAPCHDPVYDAATCATLQSEWQDAEIHMGSSSSIMAPFFANQSCDPFQPQSRACTLGNYVVYAVDAKTPEHIAATISFAAKNNIRFIIRNTGHDYLGRSTGAGALSVCTHHLTSTEVVDWNTASYSGKAMKVGAGTQGFDVMEAAHNAGLAVVGGECPTVGIAGGYTQGGGHSALSTSFGLSADNVLEWQVVIANGTLLTASQTENADLYWALSGGGPGNWGVVTSMTVKAHADAKFGGATLVMMAADNDNTAFFNAIDAFHEELAGMVDGGSMVVYYFAAGFFQIAPLNAYNKTADEVKILLAPFVARLDALNMNYTTTYTEYESYYNHYDKYFGPLPIGNIQVGIAQYGGRLIPRDNITNIGSFSRSVAEKGATFIGVGTDVGKFGTKETNSVTPAWRNALVHATLTTVWNFTAPWEEMIANQDLMTNVIMKEIEALTPTGGAYMNEADFQQPNFQTEFFGSNYKSLLCLKQKWDPEGFFYVRNAVGSESWSVADNGRMCRV